MKIARKALVSAFIAAFAAIGAHADEGAVPQGVRPLDHVFVIMMENHGYAEIIGNPSMPFLNQYAKQSGLAANYFAVAHPSLTNYLETVGGSNFGVLNDHAPDWHNATCQTNISTGIPSLDTGAYPAICPIHGRGLDAATPAVDNSNLEGNNPGPVNNVDGTASFPAGPTVAKTIAHQLVETGRRWKTYQENLPPTGADRVNSADGLWSNLNPPSSVGITDGVLGLYAVKHNPFAYFQDIQESKGNKLGLSNMVSWDGNDGLFADLAAGRAPAFSYIVPNQCNDQHGRSGAGPACDYDPSDVGTLAGLNPALMYQGDVTVQRVVTAIKASPTWKQGRNAIVVVWDESDYANAPITNQVTLVVDTSDGASAGHKSKKFYTHFSLLKSLEAGFGLPCLNHACDSNVAVMSDLFGGDD
jgi:phosphatidylinositol-3-phosphatase